MPISTIRLLNISGTLSVILHDVLVPSVVQNGSVPFVILDCHYSMNHSEKDGMILKWYLNGRTVYQWIPPAHPQVRPQTPFRYPNLIEHEIS